MYQILVEYLDKRLSSIFVDDELKSFKDIVSKIKEVIPYAAQFKDEQLRVMYRDVATESFININPQDDRTVAEVFRNAKDCGSETFKRIELKIREADSPIFTRYSSAGKVPSALPKSDNIQESSLSSRPSSRKSLYFKINNYDIPTETAPTQAPTMDSVYNWKTAKRGEFESNLHELNDEKVAIEAQIQELEKPVPEPEKVGNYASIVCSKCHRRGHRVEGNRNNNACSLPRCESFQMCGQSKKHPEYFEEIKKLRKRLREIEKNTDDTNSKKSMLYSFQTKTISAFAVGVTQRLIRAFPEKYQTATVKGKLDLQKDLASLRIICNNKIPELGVNDRQLFTELLCKFDNVNQPTRHGGNLASESIESTSSISRSTRSRSRSSSSSSDSHGSKRRRGKKHKHKHKKRSKHRRKRDSNDQRNKYTGSARYDNGKDDVSLSLCDDNDSDFEISVFSDK